MISEHAKRDPNGLALDDGQQTRSWAELADRTTRWARLLRHGLGLSPEDNAALLMHNRAEALEGILAAIQAGIWMTPINWHLTKEEIQYVARDSEARVLFVDSAHEEIASSTDCEVIVVGEELERALAASSDEPMPLDGPAGGNMIYTSGTTGLPKGVKRRRPTTLAAALEGQVAYARSIACDGSGPHLVTGPLYHAAPLMFAVYDQCAGAPIIAMEKWDEREALRIVREREVHHAHFVPTMFMRMLNRLSEEERRAFRAPALHTVLHGAAPISESAKARMIDWWGDIFYEYWGGTEGGVTTFVDTPGWRAKPGTVGKALPHYEVFSVDDQGERLPAGEVGALYARHQHLPDFFEYHGDAEKTAGAFLDPYTHTLGDIGYVDEDGWLFLADRKSNMIISGGVNIYPREIENALQEHPAVADIGVFGIPNDEWGEEVKAAIELNHGFEADSALEDEILAFGREHLAGYKVPRSVDFEPELPRTAAGKLYIRRLRERYWQGRKRRI